MPKFSVTYEFKLTDSDLEVMLERLTPGERSLVTSPKDIVTFYLKRYGYAGLHVTHERKDPNVTEIPEPMPADVAPESCSCPLHNPGNPHTKDPTGGRTH